MDHQKPTSPKPHAGRAQLVYSTTDGRQRFPDLLQVTYGDKAVIGFDRYGRTLGAVVPLEAVRILAGFADDVDDDIRARIQRAAAAMLEQLPSERAAAAEDEADEGLSSIDEVQAARRASGVQPTAASTRRRRA